LLIMLLRLLPWSDKLREHTPWLRRGGELPYGVAIAAGMVWIGLAVR
jgi:hypothetical protein